MGVKSKEETKKKVSKEVVTEIICILDRSGSMNKLVQDTIGGYNSFIEQQKKEPGKARITTVLFDNQYEVLYDSVDIETVPPLTTKEYFARGTTALLDSVGKTVTSAMARITDEDIKVIILIGTDGLENASIEFKAKEIKELLTKCQENKNWVVIYLGANVDAFGEAGNIGVSHKFAANYRADSEGTEHMYMAFSKAVSSVRGMSCMMDAQSALEADTDWREELADVEGNNFSSETK